MITLTEGQLKQLNAGLQSVPRYGVITGKVTDTQGGILQYVNVTVNGNSTQADADGEYYIRLPVGTYTATFSKPLYITESREINLTPELIVTLNITLQSQSVEIPQVRSMEMLPGMIALGETAVVSCECLCYTPGTYSIDCVINGTVMTADYTFSATKVHDSAAYEFTPTEVGIYTATILGVTRTLEVVEAVTGLLACPKCGEPMSNDAELVEHMIRCFTFWGDPVSDWSYTKCPYCGKEIGENALWGWQPQNEVIIRKVINHIKSSHPLSCPYCNEDFTFAGCATTEGCTEGIPRLEVLQEHMRIVHGIIPEPPEVNFYPLAAAVFYQNPDMIFEKMDDIQPWQVDHWTLTQSDIDNKVAEIRTLGEFYANYYPSADVVEGPMFFASFECEYDRTGCPSGGLPPSGFKAIIPILEDKNWTCHMDINRENDFAEIESFTGSGSTVKFRAPTRYEAKISPYSGETGKNTIFLRIEYDNKTLVILYPMILDRSFLIGRYSGDITWIIPELQAYWREWHHQDSLEKMTEARDFLIRAVVIPTYRSSEWIEKRRYYRTSFGLGYNYTTSQVYAFYNNWLSEENEDYNSEMAIYDQLKAKYDASWEED